MSYISPNHKENVRRYRAKHKTKIAVKQRDVYRKKYKYHMLKRAEYRAKEKGIPFALTVDDFEIPTVCPILGVELEVAQGKREDHKIYHHLWIEKFQSLVM